MQGVQPSPKSRPSTGAPATPHVGTVWMRHSRCSPGMRPMKARPMRMTSTPSTRLMTSAYSSSRDPAPPKSAP